MFSVLSMSNSSNASVTQFYVETIYDALKINNDVEWFSFDKLPSKNNILIVATATDAIKLLVKGYRNIGVWVQGILPEESYLKHNSLIRKKTLDYIEMVVLRKAKILFMVSDAMVSHYTNKYHMNIKDKTFVMPCFNTVKVSDSFTDKKSKGHRVFTYIGSTSPWQCFDETLSLYKKLEERIPDCELKVYTPDIEYAKSRIKEQQIKNSIVKYVNNSELANELKTVTYGFVLRKNSIVNSVATPTKISTYLANGVIPIFSRAIHSFANESSSMKYAFCMPNLELSEELVEFIMREIDYSELNREYTEIFNTYYGRTKYIHDIALFINNIDLK